jgi:hypothetical protein
VSPDFKDLLFAFNAHGVEYLVVGAQALAAHGRVRATGDLDVWVRPEAANAKRVIEALRVFGAPLRIDVLTSIADVAFDEAWADRMTAKFVDLSVPVLSAKHLIKNKRAVGRTQDLADLEWLERLGKK